MHDSVKPLVAIEVGRLILSQFFPLATPLAAGREVRENSKNNFQEMSRKEKQQPFPIFSPDLSIPLHFPYKTKTFICKRQEKKKKHRSLRELVGIHFSKETMEKRKEKKSFIPGERTGIYVHLSLILACEAETLS